MTTTTLDATSLEIKTNDGIEVAVPTLLLRELGWIPEDRAEEFCNHDVDSAYADGVQEGRTSAMQGEEGIALTELLKRFHDDTHEGPYQFCYERPCREIAQELG